MRIIVGRRSGKSFREFVTIFELVNELQAKLNQAVEDMRMLGRMGANVCPVCAHYNHGEGSKEHCITCITNRETDNFEWRGNNMRLFDIAIKKDVATAPTVDAVPVVHAYWMHDTYCSNCRAAKARPWAGYLEQNSNTFCHVCGAKMDGGASDD